VIRYAYFINVRAVRVRTEQCLGASLRHCSDSSAAADSDSDTASSRLSSGWGGGGATAPGVLHPPACILKTRQLYDDELCNANAQRDTDGEAAAAPGAEFAGRLGSSPSGHVRVMRGRHDDVFRTTDIIPHRNSTAAMSSTSGCRLLTAVLLFCGLWNFGDPSNLNDSSVAAAARTTYLQGFRLDGDPTRTTGAILHSGPLTSSYVHVTPPSTVRSTSRQSADKINLVSSSGNYCQYRYCYRCYYYCVVFWLFIYCLLLLYVVY